MVDSTSCHSTLSSTSPWHTAGSDRLSFFRSSSSPFTNLLALCPKTAPCPEAAPQATTTAAADHCKAFPKPLRAGFWLAATLTRSERDANEVRTRSEIKFWETDPLMSPDKFFGSHTLSHSCQNSKTQELSAVERANQTKQQLQARGRRQKRRQRASKGDRRETKEHKLGKQGGGDKFERAQPV